MEVKTMPDSEERLSAIEEQLNDIKLAISHMFELVALETDEKKKQIIRIALAQLLKTRVRPRPGSK